MYEDILDDPEVQELIEKYDGVRQNDIPLDQMGNEIEAPEEEEAESNGEEEDKDKDASDAEDDAELNLDSLEGITQEVPEVDYTPQTDFSKTLDLSKIDDGFQKYVLTHLEPLTVTDKEGNSVRAYTEDDLPKGFEFKDQAAAQKASADLARLDMKGADLKKEYEDLVESRENALAQNEVLSTTRESLEESISNGEFPKLELDKDGNLEEGSKVNQLANDVIKYQEDINKDRSPSRAISFDTALNRFRKDNADRFKDLEEEEDPLEREDKERQQFARRTSKSAARSTSNSKNSQYDNLSREEFDELLNDPNFDVRKLLK